MPQRNQRKKNKPSIKAEPVLNTTPSKEQGLAETSPSTTPLSDEEYSSLERALGIMLFVSAIVFISTSLLGIRLFTFEFYLAIVYAPTILLFIGWVVMLRRRRVVTPGP
ncbi:MAG TPA: hypothetical protein VE177_02245 [Candidatus Binatus sp.]|nr:hypothetical protein [Candidatus Binatus sp.]